MLDSKCWKNVTLEKTICVIHNVKCSSNVASFELRLYNKRAFYFVIFLCSISLSKKSIGSFKKALGQPTMEKFFL